MINAMRTLALDYLFNKLGDKDNLSQNMEEWYQRLRNDHPERLSPFLVESGENVERIYILEEDVNKDTVRLVPEDMTEEKATWLPFMRPSGPQGAQVGPVIKRSYSKAKGGGPSSKILKTTMESFEKIADNNKPWSAYFNEIVGLLNRPQLKLPDSSVINWKEAGYKNLFSSAVDKIGEQKQTIFLTVRDSNGKLPGQRQEYLDYLILEKLAGGTRYVTGNAPAKENQTCPLCGKQNVTVYPNALKGAGINISNADRAGAFPDIDTGQAWKGYALCNPCADLLYVYKFYFLKKDSKNQNPFITPIAGENAVVIPFAAVDYQARQNIWREVKDFVRDTSSNAEEAELTGRVVDYLQKNNQKEVNGEELVNILLDAFIDARLFGSSFAFKAEEVKGESSRKADWKPIPKTMTGAVQLNMGEVLHKAEEMDIHGTSIFASGQDKTQGTFTTYFGLRYALIGFSGVANEHSAEISRMSDDDYEYLLKAMWHGVRVCGNTRTKVGQIPHLLIDINYNQGEEFQLGRLHDYVKMVATNGKDEKAWASPEDYRLDMQKLINRLEKQKDRIEKVRYAKSPDIQFAGDLPSEWQDLDVENLKQ